MIVDTRIYSRRPSRTAEFVALRGEFAWPLQRKHLGWFTTQEGQPDQVVHPWAYGSQADRERRRDALEPTDFSPVR